MLMPGLNNNDSVWVILTSDAPCASPTTATSNKVLMIVNPSVTPTASITSNDTSICAGTSVTFIATISNGGSSPSYQWEKNGNPVGTNTPVYTDNGLVNGDSVWVELTSNATCAVPATVNSVGIAITVNPNVVPTVTNNASATTICTGGSVTFIATPTGGGTAPTYQWVKNGVDVGTNFFIYTDNALNNNDSVWVIMTSNALVPAHWLIQVTK